MLSSLIAASFSEIVIAADMIAVLGLVTVQER